LRQKAEVLSQNESAQWNSYSFTIQDEEVKVAFLQEKQKWSQS
jgi:N-dimethylarginine dimethylaminohydrolase